MWKTKTQALDYIYTQRQLIGSAALLLVAGKCRRFRILYRFMLSRMQTTHTLIHTIAYDYTKVSIYVATNSCEENRVCFFRQ